MRISKHLIGCSTLLIMALFSTVKAELKPTDHKGFFLNFGFGGGSAGLNEKGSSGDNGRESGVTLNIRLGGALKQNLLLGGEIDAWRKEEGGLAIQFTNVAATLTYYPTQILFLKAGPAYSAATAEAFGFTETENGIGFTGGIGTELRLTRKFALLPMAQYIYQDYKDFTSNFFSITLDVGWFW